MAVYGSPVLCFDIGALLCDYVGVFCVGLLLGRGTCGVMYLLSWGSFFGWVTFGCFCLGRVLCMA